MRGVLAHSESLDRNEFQYAQDVASAHSLPISIVETHEYSNPNYRKNDALRCYHCKTELFEVVQAGRYDRIVLDTPPVSQAIDLLQAPARIVQFLDSGLKVLALAVSRGSGTRCTAP